MVPSFKYWHYIVGVVSRINPIRHSPDKTIPLPALLPKYLLWGGSYFSQISEDVIHANLLLSCLLSVVGKNMKILCPHPQPASSVRKLHYNFQQDTMVTAVRGHGLWRDTAALISNILMRRGED